ncbi:MAG: zinc ribbon domain-containing protein [Candidatus Neomarinimicrobiota bacterium]
MRISYGGNFLLMEEYGSCENCGEEIDPDSRFCQACEDERIGTLDRMFREFVEVVRHKDWMIGDKQYVEPDFIQIEISRQVELLPLGDTENAILKVGPETGYYLVEGLGSVQPEFLSLDEISRRL